MDLTPTERPLPTVFILGAHPLNGYSMRRYTSLLEKAYRDMGRRVRVLRPVSSLSRGAKNTRLRKLAIYVEKLLFFPLILWQIPRESLVHVADHSDGIWLLHPRLRTVKSLVTCHDLFAIQAAQGVLPEYFPRWPGRTYQRLIASGLQKSREIVAVSECTALDVSNFLTGIPCKVIHNPLDPAFAASALRPSKGYALIVGANDWRKRRSMAISAWISAECQRRQPRRLVLVGPDLSTQEVALLEAACVDPATVTTLSRISEDSLIRLYSEADYLILASKYEGFAWPIIEANALGVPAMCANEPILNETGCGNVFFDPDLHRNDWEGLLSELEGLRHDDQLIARAKSFSHERFVANLLSVVKPCGVGLS